MPRQFHPFTQEHFIVLGIGALVGALFLIAGKRGGNSQKRATAVLASIMVLIFPLNLAAWLVLDIEKSWDNYLPFHLCDIAAMTAALALITKRRIFCSLTYFWGLAATIQGLATPAIVVGFPEPAFIMFFVHHFAVVIAALYLPIVIGWRPALPLWKGPLETYGWSMVYLAFAMTMNWLLGTNFAFAAHPPPNPSLIDHLGPWPWYLFAMQALAVTFFFLLTLPFLKSSKKP